MASRVKRIMATLSFGGILSGGAPPPVDLPPHSLMLAVAGWCAPCRIELGRIDTIAAAAGPWRVRIVPVDLSPGTRAMLREIEPERVMWSARVVATISAMTGGLPFSVMTDDAGRPCARHNRPLDRNAVLRMRRECEA